MTTLAKLRPWLTTTLIVLWVGLFVSTHIPLPAGTPVPDYLLHFGAFALLGTVLGFWSASFHPLTFGVAARLLGVLTAYGAFDEITQKFVPGRVADVRDWAADSVGALAALIVLFASLRQTTPSTLRDDQPASLATTEAARQGGTSS